MSLEREWTLGGWPPTGELVWCLFDVSIFSSVSNRPIVILGRAHYANKEILFFEDGETHPIHPHFIPIAWRLR